MRTSLDEGRTFALERVISEQYAAYSDLTVLKDKDRTIGVLWERAADRGYQFITVTRLNREWLEPAPGSAGTPMIDARPQVISRGEAAGTYQAFPDVCRLRVPHPCASSPTGHGSWECIGRKAGPPMAA